MKIGRIDPITLFPLAVFAFLAVSVNYVNSVFTTTTRWVFLALLLIVILKNGIRLFKNAGFAGMSLLVYVFWCGLTCLWSELPQLTFLKVVAFVFVALTMIPAGIEWVRRRPPDRVMYAFLPITALALAAGVLGYTSTDARFAIGVVEVYQGLTGNPNMLGLLVTAGIPFALWWFYLVNSRNKKKSEKLLALGLIVVLIAIVLSTVSRSSMLMLACIGIFYLVATGKARWAIYLFLAVMAGTIVLVLFPDLLDRIAGTFFYKGNRDSASFSRDSVWEESLQHARQGGWFGGGYGVTIGDNSFTFGLTALGYGREHGNTQLAIMEQTGIVGLALYLLFVVLMVARLVVAFLRNAVPDQKVVLGIVSGSVIGMLLHSCFEAWWVAPGSPEAPLFWGLVGVGFGCAKAYSVRRPVMIRSNAGQRPPFRQGRPLPNR